MSHATSLDWSALPTYLKDANDLGGTLPVRTGRTVKQLLLEDYGFDLGDERNLHMLIHRISDLFPAVGLETEGNLARVLKFTAAEQSLLDRALNLAWASVLLMLTEYASEDAKYGLRSYLQQPVCAQTPEQFTWAAIRPDPAQHLLFAVREQRQLNEYIPAEALSYINSIRFTRAVQAGRPLHAYSKVVGWALLSTVLIQLMALTESVSPHKVHQFCSHIAAGLFSYLPKEYQQLACPV